MNSESSQPSLELTILMPCLNEAETVAACIEKAQRFLGESGVEGEILVADNGSTDGSPRIATSAGARVIEVPQRGYGHVLMGGISAARGRYVIMGDADDSYDFSRLAGFLEKLRDGYELVMGNRFTGGIQAGAMPPLHRYLGNPVLTGLGRLFFRSPVRDFHCGLRGFHREAIMRLDLQTTGMEFASEMIVKASLNGMRITEVPTTLQPAGRSRQPHLRTWRDGWRHLRFMLLYSPRWLFLYPGVGLMIIGSLGMLALLPGPIRVGRISFDIHTMLYAAMAVIIGFQAVVFAVFTKIFAMSEGLLPRDPAFDRLFRFVTLETGLLVGMTLLSLGSLTTLIAFVQWGQLSFGPLEPAKTFRLVTPAMLAMVLGTQITLASFFLSVLGLGRHQSPRAG